MLFWQPNGFAAQRIKTESKLYLQRHCITCVCHNNMFLRNKEGKKRLVELIFVMIFLHIFHSGGVEPIAELAGDGEEIEVPQEATKFIKKKQPSKKTKKGRITNSISFLCLFIWSWVFSSS